MKYDPWHKIPRGGTKLVLSEVPTLALKKIKAADPWGSAAQLNRRNIGSPGRQFFNPSIGFFFLPFCLADGVQSFVFTYL